MRSFLALLLALLLLFPCFALGEEEETAIEEIMIEEISVDEGTEEEPLLSIPLPIDFSGGCIPLESGYRSETVYEDPTIRVEITYKNVKTEYDPSYTQDPSYTRAIRDLINEKEIGVFIVDVRIGHASQLRTISNKSFDKNSADNVLAIAGRVNPVVAVNGDFATRRSEGLILRQGTVYKNKLKGALDVLAIDEDGDFHMFVKPKKGEVPEIIDGKKIINAFYFGPILVENGEVPDQFTNFKYLEPDKCYCRSAICQIGPLHYKLILTTMQETHSTTGLPLRAFARICRDEGAQSAYNLDGGRSASLIFHGELANSSDKKEPRDVTDIVYFASAWNGEGQE